MKSALKYFNFIVALILSIIYASGRIPPTQGFNLWITSFIIPVALVANHLLLIVFALLRKKSALYYLIALLIGSPYLTSTLGIKHLFKKRNEDTGTLSVLNYNIGVYSMRPYFYQNRDSARLALKDWILNADADVKCLQEFANIPWAKEFNLIAQLKDRGLYYSMSTDQKGDYRGRWTQGTIIISKYPIISYGDVYASKNGFNRIAYADLKIAGDTVRIVNVHLESMGITQVDPRSARDLSDVKSQTYTVLRKLRNGVVERSNQVRELADFIERSPYRVICAGDFNDMPYSYNYRYMKNRMKNSFEESGRGFGFTYNGNKLRMLRIDNQFYSSGMRSVDFQTLDTVKFSDHFPVRGEYLIEKAN